MINPPIIPQPIATIGEMIWKYIKPASIMNSGYSRRVMFFADLMTGTKISPMTAGRSPLKIAATTGCSAICPNDIAIINNIMKEGSDAPKNPAISPALPNFWCPIIVARLITIGPGDDVAKVK